MRVLRLVFAATLFSFCGVFCLWGQAAKGSQTVTATLADGTSIRLRTSRSVSSVDARAGDLLNLEVLDEVKVDDTVVIPKGTRALAIITAAEPHKMMGRGGKLEISIDSVELVNGQKAALRAVREPSGKGSQTSIVSALAASNFSSAALIFVRGKDTVIPLGTELIAYVNGNVPLDLNELNPSTLSAKKSALSAASSATEMYISSFPDLAEIQIDGKLVGTTPSNVVVPSGEHNVAVRLAGYKIWRRTMTASGERLQVKVRLVQDGLNGSTVSNCSGGDCSDVSLGEIARQKRAMERNQNLPQ
jgi:hypothetical protein